MFSASTCFNATLRNVTNLGETNAVTRIGRILERFETEKSVQALGTCGVITEMYLIREEVQKTMFTEVKIDDGIDQITVVFPYVKATEYNLGDVIQVTVKNKVLLKNSEVVLYDTLRSEKLGVVSEGDVAVKS